MKAPSLEGQKEVFNLLGNLRGTEGLKELPVPHATSSQQAAIAKIVDKCIVAREMGCSDWESELNDRVASLYGLTAEERKIIEASAAGRAEADEDANVAWEEDSGNGS